MPDAAGGLGLAWRVAMDAVPDDQPGFFGRSQGQMRSDGGPDGGDVDHEFEAGFWGGDRCRVCGMSQLEHDEQVP